MSIRYHHRIRYVLSSSLDADETDMVVRGKGVRGLLGQMVLTVQFSVYSNRNGSASVFADTGCFGMAGLGKQNHATSAQSQSLFRVAHEMSLM